MSDMPPWARRATEPTPEELRAFHADVDPHVLRAVRASTEPTPGEVARIRPRLAPARRRVPLWLAAVPVALAIGLVVGRGAAPERVAVRAEEPGLYLVQPGQTVHTVAGIRATGDGVLRVVAGAVRIDGDLRLEIDAPVALETSDARFTAWNAVVAIDTSDRLVVEAGEVHAPGGRVLRAGERWPPDPTPAPVAVLEPAPPAPVVAPPPAPEIPKPPNPAPAIPPEIGAWGAVLDLLEAGAPAPERVAACESYVRRFPDSPLAREATALALLARAEVDPPVAALARIERALRDDPELPRSAELHTAAAFLAREKLHDCGRAAPHDRVVAKLGGEAGNRATALLGLCAASEGRAEEARGLLLQVDTVFLEDPLAQAVIQALEAP